MDNDHDSDSSSEDIEIGYDMLNLYLDYGEESDSSHNDSNDDLLNLLLQRFINT